MLDLFANAIANNRMAKVDLMVYFPKMTLMTASTATLSSAHPSIASPTKRLLDIAGAIVGLFFLAAVFPAIALAIRLESPGPIFFRQQRHGLYGRLFVLWKFRSMVADAEARKAEVCNQTQGLFFKNQNDPRITRVGRFLRRTSLDELPQFFNILMGDMSLVGTRPPTQDEAALYNSRHWQRLKVKPGLTGEWQTSGRSDVKNFDAVVDLDLRYQQRWTVGYDLKIIWKTLFVVLKRSGAC